MKNIVMVAIFAVALTGACLWFLLLREDQSGPDSEILGGSIHRVD